MAYTLDKTARDMPEYSNRGLICAVSFHLSMGCLRRSPHNRVVIGSNPAPLFAVYRHFSYVQGGSLL